MQGAPGDLDGKPYELHRAGGVVKKAKRMQWYRVGMVGLVAGVGLWWWWWTENEQRKNQREAVEKFGPHGEKARYGESFSPAKGDHFTGIPTTDTNVRGGHAGGAVKG